MKVTNVETPAPDATNNTFGLGALTPDTVTAPPTGWSLTRQIAEAALGAA